MRKIEDGLGSDRGLVKNKNSSGYLLMKNRKEGLGKIFESDNKKKRKRPRLVLSNSESGEDLSENFNKKVVVETSRVPENGNEIERRLDVFEFNEYDNIDEKRMKKERNFRDFQPGSSKRKQSDKMSKKELAGDSVKSLLKIEEKDNIDEKRMRRERDFDPGSGKQMTIGKRNLLDKMTNLTGVKKDVTNYIVKSRLKIKEDDDDGDFPISSLRQKLRSLPNQPIRLQGKNGVLKVMVNKKKKIQVPKKYYNRKSDVEIENVSRSEEIIKKNKPIGPSSFSKSKVKMEKGDVKVRKPTIPEARRSSKGVSREKVQSPENIMPKKGSVSQVKRGSGTEKQKLREKLKNILMDAGWKIDYRPRRSRDYLDAVYISPTGTAYWSIVKAYDAFRKHLGEDDEMEPSSLAEDISKLTRRTRKKIEREMKMKQKENNRNKNLKRRSTEEPDEDSDSDEDENEKRSLLVKKNGESLKRKDLLKKKAGRVSKETEDRKGRKFGRCTLLIRSSDKGLNSENEGYIAYSGKRTLFSWLIDSGVVNSSEKVKYMNRRQTRVMLEGWVTKGGIHCSCCSRVLTASKFEIHAGSKLRQPYQNILLESGVSLLQCQIDAWNKQEGSNHSGFHNVDIDGDDPNDDTCCLCGDGGDLICCDGCPSTFHQSCLDLKMLPPGDWHCPNCTCKFCGIVGASNSSMDGDDTVANLMLTCGLCEKKYHESCCQDVDVSSKSSSPSASFCGPKCCEIFYHLQKILGVKHELDAGFTWSLIHRSDLDTDASHRTFPQRVESNSKLAVALSVMDECFLPIVDRRSGINLVNSVVYNCGSNFSRLNYSGFYTIILERSDEIVAAASIRFRGSQLAEMPFIGTRHMYRRQGMCRRLLGAIESLLRSLKVEKLTIPAIAEHMHTWTAIFGFKPLDVSHKQELRSMNMLVFPGVDMLQKFLVKQKALEADIIANSGGESIVPKENHLLTPEKKPGVDACAGRDFNGGDDGATSVSFRNSDEMNEKSDGLRPKFPDSVMSSNGNTKERINKVEEDIVSPISPHHTDRLDVGPARDLNQLETVAPSSPFLTDQSDVRPTADSNQLDKQEKDRKLEAVSGVDAVVVPDSIADPVINSRLEMVSEIESDKAVVVSSVSISDPKIKGETRDGVNHVGFSSQDDTGKDKPCVREMESESHVGSVVSSEADVQSVKVKFSLSAKGDRDGCHMDNGVVVSFEPGHNCSEETPSQYKGDNGYLFPKRRGHPEF